MYMMSTDLLKHLYEVLSELEKEIKQVKEEIELQEENEKYLKAALEQECECYSKEANYSMASSMMREDVPARPVMRKRVVPVDDDGEPIQELGGGKWVRK